MLDSSCKEIKTDFAVSISRNNHNEISITIKDNKSRLDVLSLKMSLEQFALAITNLGECSAKGSLFQSSRHGLKHENNTYQLDLGMGYTEFNQKFPKTLDKLAVVNMRLDNSRYWSGTKFVVILRRYTTDKV